MQKLVEDGRRCPALENKPELVPGSVPIWQAFVVLNQCRPSGFGYSPIPLSEIKSYLEIFDFDDPEEFVHCLKVMDAAYLKHCEDMDARKHT